MPKSWARIHKDFTGELQDQWENRDFTYEETKQWIEIGFNPNDYDSAWKWKDYNFSPFQTEKYLIQGAKPWEARFFNYLCENNLPFENYQQIRDKHVEETNDWSFFHLAFEKKRWGYETYQQEWEEKDLTYLKVKEWVSIGFSPQQLDKIQEWINKDFDHHQVQTWMNIGLEQEDTDFAYYLKSHNYTPKSVGLKENYAQHYLDWKYPLNQRKEITKVELQDKKIKGSLNLNDFVNLEEVWCKGNKLTFLEVSNCLKLKIIDCSLNSLTKLDLNNNKGLEELYCWNNKLLTSLDISKNINLTNLDCSSCNLSNLDLNNCLQLKELDCANNQLTNLTISSLTNLEVIYCAENRLTSLELTGLTELKGLICRHNQLNSLNYWDLNPEKLTVLSIRNNNLHAQDLSAFSKFANLEFLLIENDEQEQVTKGFYNRFYGSLKPLNNLTKLKELGISNTNIDSGLEYLSKDIKEIYCSVAERPESKVKIIYEQLNSDSSFVFDEEKKVHRKNWKEIHKDFKYGREEWEEKGFDFHQTKEWIKSGFHPTDACFCAWLRDNKNIQSQKDLKKASDKIESLQEEYCYYVLGKKTRKINAQDFIDMHYPKAQRKGIIKLNVSSQELEGSLDLSDFINLEELECSNNWLIISCDFLLTLPNPKKLTKLNISDNNIVPTDLAIFSHFVNLEELNIGEKIFDNHDYGSKGLRNRFYGSLESLKNLNKLTELNISCTDIDSGFEYLVDKKLEIFYSELHHEASGLSRIKKEREKSQVKYDPNLKEGKTIADLKNYAKHTIFENEEDLKIWKINQPFFKKVEECWKKVNRDSNLDEFLRSQNIFLNVRNGTFEGDSEILINFLEQAGLINEKDKDIEFLRRLINELRVSKKDLMQRIVEAYFTFPEEKELLRELIKAQLQLSEVKHLRLNAGDCREQFNNLYGKLKNKLAKELMENTEFILTDCEELVSKEIELQSKLTNIRMEIDYEQRQVKNITYNINSPITSNHGHILFNNLISNNADFSFNKSTVIYKKSEVKATVNSQSAEFYNDLWEEILANDGSTNKRKESEQQAQILQEPYGVPGSSKK